MRRLHDFDPQLRVRWSDAQACYLIERKVSRGQQPDPGMYAQWDAYVAAKDGFCHVLSCAPNELDDRALWTLWVTDLERLGGASAVADAMEMDEERARRYQTDGWLGNIREDAKDWYRWMTTATPTKTSVTGDLL